MLSCLMDQLKMDIFRCENVFKKTSSSFMIYNLYLIELNFFD